MSAAKIFDKMLNLFTQFYTLTKNGECDKIKVCNGLLDYL